MKTALLLVGPLAVLIVTAFAMFGTAGPADNDVAGQAMCRLLGMVYGIYLIGLSIAWSRRRSSRRD